MKRILVPTDFSSVANTATQYAAEMAEKLATSINLVHVVNFGGPEGTQRTKWAKLEAQAVKQADEKADAVMRKLKSRERVRYETISGYPVSKVIKDYARSQKSDLIVMGTLGASGIKKVMLGSLAASVIGEVKIPVLAIPPETKFNGIRHILYATDMERLDTEIKNVAEFARAFGAFVTAVHVSEHNDQSRNTHELSKILTRFAKYSNISFTSIRNSDVKRALRTLVATIQPDVLAMFTHKLAFLEKALGKSVTRDMIFDTKVPLLSFNRSK